MPFPRDFLWGAASAAARKIEDLSARANDHLAKLERLTGGR